jgi:hypothetical protein
MSEEEKQAVRNQNKVYEAGMPGMISAQDAAFKSATNLLEGKELPGYLKPLPYGISEEMTGDIANRALKDIQPFFSQAGLQDSGTAQAVMGRTAGDVRRASAEFNINNLMQLLNIGVGGQASVTSGMTGVGSTLAGLVKGSGTTTGTYSNQSSYRYQQPWAQTFQQTMGGVQSGANAFRTMFPCWVAAELFGGWNKLKTHMARYFMLYMAPKWLLEGYERHGKAIASYISNKPILKALLRPFFEVFAFLGSVGVKEVCHG